MKLLFDQNLSVRLVDRPHELFPRSRAVIRRNAARLKDLANDSEGGILELY